MPLTYRNSGEQTIRHLLGTVEESLEDSLKLLTNGYINDAIKYIEFVKNLITNIKDTIED